MTGTYSPALVALSIAIAVAASYVALDLAGRTSSARGRARLLWLLGGATSMGLGIWSMHYVGTPASALPVPVRYDLPLVFASLLAAVCASGVALFVVSRARLGPASAILGGVVMGVGIAAMHFIGMLATRADVVHEWNPQAVMLSVLIAIAVSLIAVWLAFHLRGETRDVTRLKVAAAFVMGAAIAAMHYAGMAGVSFVPGPVRHDARAVDISTLGLIGIVVVALAALALTMISAALNRRLAQQARPSPAARSATGCCSTAACPGCTRARSTAACWIATMPSR